MNKEKSYLLISCISDIGSEMSGPPIQQYSAPPMEQEQLQQVSLVMHSSDDISS